MIDRSKRQNPHMHLLEAYLALDEAAPGRGYLDRAGALIGLFKGRLFDPEVGVVREHFIERLAEHPDPLRRQVIERAITSIRVGLAPSPIRRAQRRGSRSLDRATI
jgi:mannose-6-phosphate isomerase